MYTARLITSVSLYSKKSNYSCDDLIENKIFVQQVIDLLEKVEKFSNKWFVEENNKTVQKTGKLPEKYWRKK